jgi:hypothetical protein
VPPGKTLAEASSSCESTQSASPIDLTSTTVEIGQIAGRAGTSARVTMRYTGAPPTTGTVLWSLMASNPGGDLVQLGYKTLDGHKSAYFFFPYGEGRQHNMDGFADTSTPSEIVMILPQAGLDALGPTWWWSSVLNVDGTDIDTCP